MSDTYWPGPVYKVGDRVIRKAVMPAIYPATVGRIGTIVALEDPIGARQLMRVTFGRGLREFEPKEGYLLHSGLVKIDDDPKL
jgi:hypothetical protein